MCGFFAIYRKYGNISPEDVNRAKECTELLNHRGPNDTDFYSDDHVVLGFKRLSIQDLTNNGRQPFSVDDQSPVLAFNGEIYNFRELREEFKNNGVVFASSCDTEVLYRALVKYGTNVFAKVRGMFSFVFWNPNKREFLIARDRFGIKPMFVHENENIVVVTSEIKCILCYHTGPMSINQNLAIKYLARGFLDDSEATFFQDIHCLRPSTYKIYQGETSNEVQYWSLDDFSHCANVFDVDEFRSKLTETIDLHLIADTPVGISLSGGIDSATVLASCDNSVNVHQTLKAFTISPPHTQDESEVVDDILSKFEVEHEYVSSKLTTDELISTIDSLLDYHDEPIQQASSIYHYLLRKRAAKVGIRVLLVGEGADELLAGYKRMLLPYLLGITDVVSEQELKVAKSNACQLLNYTLEQLDSELKRFHDAMDNNESGRENTSADILFKKSVLDETNNLINGSMFPGIDPKDYGGSFKNLLKNHIFLRNIPYVLRMEDRSSMACGIESRVPFLDHKFVEYVISHSVEEFMLLGRNKSMLRRAMANILPDKVLDQKTKFNRPGSHSYLVYQLLKEVILSTIRASDNLFMQPINELEKEFLSDLKSENLARADFWFRFYIYECWKNKVGEVKYVKPIS